MRAARGAKDITRAREEIAKATLEAVKGSIIVSLLPEWRNLAPPLLNKLEEADLRLLFSLLAQQYNEGKKQGQIEGTRETLGRFYGYAAGSEQSIEQLEALLAQLKAQKAQPN